MRVSAGRPHFNQRGRLKCKGVASAEGGRGGHRARMQGQVQAAGAGAGAGAGTGAGEK